ncbi:J domain-containing protein [Paenibacillus sacheonensis]|uniref:J domain-containing protein n=1 Tax=Paenibacillus sacheonensis TaxID=742054 RepID=A0A7X4YUD7_9BACL|nr:J domain-containing protein [Paenibacillus sacheonensis]MBM7569254.1 curved DNA-binding protein CbpA [Paenibacillus sacheonensis]NBC71736.1 J domain-containing protein [Paenibacillus sacheonensis]
MDELKKAYELLGLPEGAAKEDVEKRYFLLIRRERSSRQREGSEQPNDQTLSLEEINKAYKLILEHDEKKTLEQFNSAAYGKYKGMAGSAQKFDHFFSYYKFHVLGAIALVLIIIFGTKAYVDHRHKLAELAKLPPIDVSVSFYGEYFSQDGSYPVSDLKPLEAKFLSQFPDWQRVEAFFTYVPSELKSEQDSALIQKSMIDLMMNKADVYILDKLNFEKLAQNGSLLPLDGDNAAKLGENHKPEQDLKASTEDVPEQHVYGVDISGSPLVKELPVIGKEYIAGIRVNAKRPDNAFIFIDKYLEH